MSSLPDPTRKDLSVAAVLGTIAVVLMLLLVAGALLFWRLYQDSLRRADDAAAALHEERLRSDRHQAA